jgi:hypothetical protein
VNASFLEGAAITTPSLQRFGCEEAAPYAALALDADQSRAEATSYVVKRKRGHR